MLKMFDTENYVYVVCANVIRPTENLSSASLQTQSLVWREPCHAGHGAWRRPHLWCLAPVTRAQGHGLACCPVLGVGPSLPFPSSHCRGSQPLGVRAGAWAAPPHCQLALSSALSHLGTAQQMQLQGSGRMAWWLHFHLQIC